MTKSKAEQKQARLKEVMHGYRKLTEHAEEDLFAVLEEFSDREKLKEQAQGLLMEQWEDLLAKGIGFERDRWERGNWRVDHCNGRNSALVDIIKESANHDAEEWFRSQFAEKGLPVLSQQQKNATKKEYKECLERAIRRRVKELAESAAPDIALALVKGIVDEHSLPIVLKDPEDND